MMQASTSSRIWWASLLMVLGRIMLPDLLIDKVTWDPYEFLINYQYKRQNELKN
jgi:hypothetical protein